MAYIWINHSSWKEIKKINSDIYSVQKWHLGSTVNEQVKWQLTRQDISRTIKHPVPTVVITSEKPCTATLLEHHIGHGWHIIRLQIATCLCSWNERGHFRKQYKFITVLREKWYYLFNGNNFLPHHLIALSIAHSMPEREILNPVIRTMWRFGFLQSLVSSSFRLSLSFVYSDLTITNGMNLCSMKTWFS